MDDLADPISNPDWVAIGTALLSGFTSNENFSLDGIRGAVVAGATQAEAAKMSAAFEFITWIAANLGKALTAVEEPFMPVIAGFAAPIVAGMFGAEIDASTFAKRANSEARGGAARAIVDAFMGQIAGEGTGPAEPSDEGAKRLATAGVHAALEGWFLASVPELLSDIIPFEVGHFDAFTELPEELIRALGIGRLIRRALSPLVDAAAATPMKWKTEKTYRTTLLPASTVARQWARGRWDWEDVVEELARQGYSDERIDAIISEQQKFYSPADVYDLMSAGVISSSDATQHLRDAGYDADRAKAALKLELVRDVAQFERQLAGEAATAFANGRISESLLETYTTGAALNAEQSNRLRELAHARRALRNKPLSPSQAEACVKAGIFAVADYRRALETDGYAPDAIDALELLLRLELDKQKDLEAARAAQAADKAKKEAERAAAAAAREAEVNEQRKLARRGALTDLKRAVVTGLIPVSRYQEVLAADYDGDTVDILTRQVEADRQVYLDGQAKAADAAKRATGKSIGLGDLRQAVLEDVLTLEQFTQSLQQRGLDAGDVAILTNTLRAQYADLQAAKKKRASAGAAAARKSIDLGRFEQLVRAGVRTIAQYNDLLKTLDYDEASIAAIDQLLQLKIAADARAKSTRAGVASTDPAKGLSLEQARRAVILGVSTEDEFQTYLTNSGYTADAQVVLLEELRDDVTVAEAARSKRESAASTSGARALPLATITKAASLGIIAPPAYQARLEASGFADDDVAIEMELLFTEIASVQASRKTAAAADAARTSKGLSLGDLANAVKHGAASLEDYRSRAITLGLSAADAATLVQTLGDELETTNAAKARRDAIAGDLSGKNFSLDSLDDQVRAGALSIDGYGAALLAKGYAPDDVELLQSLLVDELTNPAPAV